MNSKLGVCNTEFSCLVEIILSKLRTNGSRAPSEVLRDFPEELGFAEFRCDDIGRDDIGQLITDFNFETWSHEKFKEFGEKTKNSLPWNLVGESFEPLAGYQEYPTPVEAYEKTKAQYFIYIKGKKCLVVEVDET